MKKKDISTKQRKWILGWVEKYRNGETPDIPTNGTVFFLKFKCLGDRTTKRYELKKKKNKKK
jgi:hypothetical protein